MMLDISFFFFKYEQTPSSLTLISDTKSPRFANKLRSVNELTTTYAHSSLSTSRTLVQAQFNINTIMIIEFCAWFLRKSILYILLNLQLSRLSPEETILHILWTRNLSASYKLIFNSISLDHVIYVTYLSIKFKDLNLLTNLWTNLFRKISFWKHRLIIHFLSSLFRNLITLNKAFLRLRGFRFRLKGKISVGGNSRTRTLFSNIGNSSFSKKENRILHSNVLIKTFTGVLNLQFWYAF